MEARHKEQKVKDLEKALSEVRQGGHSGRTEKLRIKREIEEANEDVEKLKLSLEDAKLRDLSKEFEMIKKNFSRVDLLFNNAGTFLSSKTIDEINFSEWKEVIEVNINGMFLFSKHAFLLMKNQSPKGGRIINNGSVSSITPRPGSIAYTATKHAVTGMTKSLALDGRQFNIVCSQIDIGNADTPMTEGIKKGIIQADGSIKKEPTFDPEHIADAVLHLVGLPLDTNILNMTIMASNMPFIGRG